MAEELEEQRQLLVSTQEEADFHRDGKLELRTELIETRRQAAAALVEQRAHLEQTTLDLAERDAKGLEERASLLALLTPAAQRVEKKRQEGSPSDHTYT